MVLGEGQHVCAATLTLQRRDIRTCQVTSTEHMHLARWDIIELSFALGRMPVLSDAPMAWLSLYLTSRIPLLSLADQENAPYVRAIHV
jgi:hypothetical protein